MCQRLDRQLRIRHFSGGQDRYCDNFFKGLTEIQINPFVKIDRRIFPIGSFLRRIDARHHVKAITAGCCQDHRSGQGFFQITTLFGKFFLGQSLLSPSFAIAFYCQPHNHRKITAAGSLDGGNDFGHDPKAVLQLAAVVIATLIIKGQGKTVQQGSRLNFDAIKTGRFDNFGRLGKGRHQLPDFGNGHHLATFTLFRPGISSQTSRQLYKDPGALVMDLPGHFLPGRNISLGVKPRGGIHTNCLFRVERGHLIGAGNDQTHPALSPGHIKSAGRIGIGPVFISRRNAHRRHKQPVFEFQLIDCKGLE